jgi:hypothetical protein
MSGYITQRIPAGSLSPQEQIEQAVAVVREAADRLEVGDMARIEAALGSMQKPLLALAAAGVLSGITFQLRDEAGACGIAVVFDLFDVADVEAMDLSQLRLVASPQGEGRLEIVCLDEPVGRHLVERAVLPCLSEEALDCCQVTWQGSEAAAEVREEDILEALEEEETADEYDDGEDWR